MEGQEQKRFLCKGALFFVRDWWYYPFPFEDSLEHLDSFEGEFLHLEGLLGKGFDLVQLKKRGWILAN